MPSEGGIASTSLCADTYVLELAGPGRIAALSWQVDAPVSAAPDWARDLPQAWGDAERLLELAPGLTVFGAGQGGRTLRLLERAGFDGVELAWATDFQGVRANLRMLGGVMGREVAAEEAIVALDARLAELARRSAARHVRPRILYLSASGGTAGAGTYVDAAIRAAGGTNVVAEAGIAGWPAADPESLLGVEADIVLTSFFTDGYESMFSRGRRHAAYRVVLDGAERVDIPAGDWPCAGPRLIVAAERIADAIDAWVAGRDRAS